MKHLAYLISSTVDVIHTKVSSGEVPVMRLGGDPEDPGVSQLSADHGAVLHVPPVVTDRRPPNSNVALGEVSAACETQSARAATGAACHPAWGTRNTPVVTRRLDGGGGREG